MVLFRFREVVKEGHFTAYKDACKAWNALAERMGLEPFRYYYSVYGDRNEVYGEAEYPDAEDLERRFDAANAAKDPEFIAAVEMITAQLVEGRSYDWLLKPVDLG